MNEFIDKSLILSRIKLAYALKNDAELARFLEIKANTLSNWYNRNTIDYDKIFSKCESLNLNWLLTGKGIMKKNNENENSIANNDNNPTSNTEHFHNKYVTSLEFQLKDKDKVNTLQEEKIADLEKKIESAQLKNKEEMSAQIKNQQASLQMKEEIILAKNEVILSQTHIINQLNHQINNIKNICRLNSSQFSPEN